MEQEILEYIKKNNGNVCLKHIEAEFHYVNRKIIKDAIEVLLFDGYIEYSNGSIRDNGEDFRFFKVKTPIINLN